MKDETIAGSELVRTPVLGAGWAGHTEGFELTLSDEETVVLESSRLKDVERRGDRHGSQERETEPRGEEVLNTSWIGLRLWQLARGSLVGAIICGALCGLALALLMVLAMRVMPEGRPQARPLARLLLVEIHVREPGGSPVRRAVIRAGDQQLQTDDQGLATFQGPLAQAAKPHRSRFEITCPPGMRTPEPSRELIVPVSPGRPSLTIERSLTFFCEPTHVPMHFKLQVRGGDARFWLDEEELGVSSRGALERTILVPKRSERILRALPVVPSGETRKPRLLTPERTLVVLDQPAEVQHLVEIAWPKPKIRARPRHVPYRL